MKSIKFIAIITGLFISIYGICSAIFDKSPYWYSFFVIGSFLFFDPIDQLLNKNSNLSLLFKGRWRTFVFTYLSYLGLAILIDFIMGRTISDNWIYPHFDLKDEIIHVILIGYPFAFFTVSSFYRTVYGMYKKFFPFNIDDSPKSSKIKKIIVKTLLVLTIISISLPIINFFAFNNSNSNKVVTICLILGIFSISPITFLLFPRSFLGTLLLPDKRAIISLITTSIISAFSHELPNTYSWAWRYQNIPFISSEILGVNIIVLSFGWLFLTILAISVNDLFFQLTREEFFKNGSKRKSKVSEQL